MTNNLKMTMLQTDVNIHASKLEIPYFTQVLNSPTILKDCLSRFHNMNSLHLIRNLHEALKHLSTSSIKMKMNLKLTTVLIIWKNFVLWLFVVLCLHSPKRSTKDGKVRNEVMHVVRKLHNLWAANIIHSLKRVLEQITKFTYTSFIFKTHNGYTCTYSWRSNGI